MVRADGKACGKEDIDVANGRDGQGIRGREGGGVNRKQIARVLQGLADGARFGMVIRCRGYGVKNGYGGENQEGTDGDSAAARGCSLVITADVMS